MSCPTRFAVRAFATTVVRSHLHRAEGSSSLGLTGKVDRFGGVTVNLGDSGLPPDISESLFSTILRGLLRRDRINPKHIKPRLYALQLQLSDLFTNHH